jgi:hypothetical protein
VTRSLSSGWGSAGCGCGQGGGKERIVVNMASQIRIVSASNVAAFDMNDNAVSMYAGERFQCRYVYESVGVCVPSAYAV